MQPPQPNAGAAQLQDLQKMRLQQMQALRQQHSVGQRQQQMMNPNNSFGNLSQNIPQISQSPFGGQQWVDPQMGQQGVGNQRNSMSTNGVPGGLMNNQALSMMQHGGSQQMTPQGGLLQGNAQQQQQAALFWNNLPGSGKGHASAGGVNTGSNAFDNLGIMDGSMEAMIQQQQAGGMGVGHVNSKPQLQQMHAQLVQQQMGGAGSQQGGLNALGISAGGPGSGSGHMEASGMGHKGGIPTGNQQNLMNQFQSKIGANAMLNANRNGLQQSPNTSTTANSALFIQQQNIINQLKRQLQQQQQQQQVGQGLQGNARISSPASVDPRGSGSVQGNAGGMVPQGLHQRGSLHQLKDQNGGSGMLQRQASSSSVNTLPGMQQQSLGGVTNRDQLNMANLLHQQQLNQQQNQMSMQGMSMHGQNASNFSSSPSFMDSLMGGNGGTGSMGNDGIGIDEMRQRKGMDDAIGLNPQLKGTSAQGIEPLDGQPQQIFGMGQDMNNNGQFGKDLLMGNKGQDGSSGNSMPALDGNKAGILGDNTQEMIGKTKSSAKSRRKGSQSRQRTGEDVDKGLDGESPTEGTGNQAFLDGAFAGGWQSNEDLPDRRKIILNIVRVIEQMRPDANKMSRKLPEMAKRLEEHLYRSAVTKQEYLDPNTLKKRLQMIAHGLGVHRSGDGSSKKQGSKTDTESKGKGNAEFLDPNFTSKKVQEQFQQLHRLQQQKLGNTPGRSILVNADENVSSTSLLGSNAGGTNSLQRMMQQSFNPGGIDEQFNKNFGQMGGNNVQMDTLQQLLLKQQQGQLTHQQQELQRHQARLLAQTGQTENVNMLGGLGVDNGGLDNQAKASGVQGQEQLGGARVSGNNGAGSSAQKKKLIKQQQQRLLLLRHASRCEAGPKCPTKFCAQMVKLWRHMKKCRDKDCKTAHCLSSRCVLNHYRMCKNQNKTASCEVCAPVMKQIKKHASGNDPIEDLNNSDSPRPTNQLDGPPPPMRTEAGNAQDLIRNFGPVSGMSQQQLQVAGVPSGAPLDASAQNSRKQQVEELQVAQQRIRQQQMLLQQLKQQQAQLLEKQNVLQQEQQHVMADSQQAIHIRQQQGLLQKLQQQFQQQQHIIQQELERHAMALHASQMQQRVGVNDDPMADIHSQSDIISRTDLNAKSLGKRKSSSQGRKNSKKHASEGKQRAAKVKTGKGKRLSKMITGSEDSKIEPLDVESISMEEGIHSDKEGPRKVDSSNPLGPVSSVSEPERLLPPESTTSTAKPLADPSSLDNDIEEVQPPKVLHHGSWEQRISTAPLLSKISVDQHIKSLRKHLQPAAMTRQCMPLIRGLLKDQYAFIFQDPVDPEYLGLPDYFEIIKTPMHLKLIEERLGKSYYTDVESFSHDTKLVFGNAILYNGESSDVGQIAQSLLQRFENEMMEASKVLTAEQEAGLLRGRGCGLCGWQRRFFNPTVLRCSGFCGGRTIGENVLYYSDRSRTNIFCELCFERLPDDGSIGEGTVLKKQELHSQENDAVGEEAWIQCDHCKSWNHQVCALVSEGKSKNSGSYMCLECQNSTSTPLIPNDPSRQFLKGAKELPRCQLSDDLEEALEDALAKAYEEAARMKNIPVGDMPKAEDLCIRVLADTEKKQSVRKGMYDRYSSKGFPAEFSFRSKCIALFQTIHGVDVLLFVMYVHEYDDMCPLPNRRRVYISYLDSVKYLEPACYRTTVYHTILIEYLRFVKQRGFLSAYIWSCPPSPGDDFIFHRHPKDQRIPQSARLCKWYQRMIERAKLEGVVVESTTLTDAYSSDSRNGQDVTRLPYFEGDYIPGEIEKIIVETRDADESGTDVVADKLFSAVNRMKDNFIVLNLRDKNLIQTMDEGGSASNWIGSEGHRRISGKDSSTICKNDSSSNPQNEGKDSHEGEAHLGELMGACASLDEGNSAMDDMRSTLARAAEAAHPDFPVGSTKDEDAPRESELFETRQHFLNFCQANSLQFDELRKSKHSSMIVLHHLHNPPVPFCERMRPSNNRLRDQQLELDERRRQVQNDICDAATKGR